MCGRDGAASTCSLPLSLTPQHASRLWVLGSQAGSRGTETQVPLPDPQPPPTCPHSRSRVRAFPLAPVPMAPAGQGWAGRGPLGGQAHCHQMAFVRSDREV